MFNAAFDHLGARPGNDDPAAHRQEIDRVNDRSYAGPVVVVRGG